MLSPADFLKCVSAGLGFLSELLSCNVFSRAATQYMKHLTQSANQRIDFKFNTGRIYNIKAQLSLRRAETIFPYTTTFKGSLATSNKALLGIRNQSAKINLPQRVGHPVSGSCVCLVPVPGSCACYIILVCPKGQTNWCSSISYLPLGCH